MDPMGKVQRATSHHSEFRISNEKYLKTKNSRNPSSKFEAKKKKNSPKKVVNQKLNRITKSLSTKHTSET